MPNLHIVIGNSNTRKSSLLRCLTGVGSGKATKNIKIAREDGVVITVYCILSALQESYKPRTPAEFIAHITTLNPIPSDIAIALRVDRQGLYPESKEYLRAFKSTGWRIENVALLGSEACLTNQEIDAVNIEYVTFSSNQPTNMTASLVRRTWKWV